MSLPGPPPSPWWQIPVSWWWRSLPLRVIASVFVASVLVLVLGGFLLMQQASLGVMEGKKESVRNESRQALFVAQQQLNAADPTGGANVDKLLTDLAFGYANRTGGTEQFEVIILAGSQTITAGRADAASVPDNLRQQVAASTDLLMAPTEVVYRDGSPSVPGLVSGSHLTLPGTGTYEIYFVFPLNQEVDTLRFLRSAAGTTGAILVILLTFIAALVARQVVTPVRAARRAAESLASGNLDDRMQVKGQDDLARLATSMNYMAEELQKQITQLEDLSNVQQTFVSDVSHELRTPLTTVRMAAEVLYEARDEFDPVSARSAELLQNELDRFEALLGDLLEISRFDAGAIRLHLEDLLVAEFVRQAIAVSSLPGTPITVTERAERLVMQVDRRRLARVIANLIDNARLHGGGHPEVTVSEAENEGEPLGHVWIAVEDHGAGVPVEERHLVFERFARGAVAGRRSSSDGAGLGLALVDEHVRLHGGNVRVEDRRDGEPGARFVIELPAEEVGV